MSFLNSIVLLATAVFVVLIPIFIGHALVESEAGPVAWAAVFFVVAIALAFLHTFLARRRERKQESGER